MSASRRQFLATATASAAFAGFARLANAQEGASAAAPYRSEVAGYGALRADPAGVLDLPEGFSYTVVSKAGDPMSDGLVTPFKMDGMGCFPLDGDRVILVRNHEIKPRDLEITAFGPGRTLAPKIAADRVYDFGDDGLPLGGGTTTLVYDLKTRKVERHHLSLAGTSTNCAGGITPWGSWLTCEETTQGAGQEARKDHGWVFEVPSQAKGLVDPTPITGMGRFRHEAACIDPRTGIVYQTEDMGDGLGLFYRYLPNDPTKLHAGGKLQALALPEGVDADPRNWETRYWKQGDWRNVRWVDLDGVDNPYEDLRYRGHAKGAAWFARGEGVFFGQGELYFACTSGGPNGGGQIMRYVPSPEEGRPGEADKPARLQLFVEPQDVQTLEMGDNIAPTPWGHMIVCEDKIGGTNFLRGVTGDGKIYTLGRNALQSDGDAAGTSELAGACFSPDGTTLFVNIYMPGTTLAITGPWASFKA
ncbi:alkaline phosphatase PhoX [Phenylobacterium sp.]|uniref:alkaline phosphatase PhoX n=1 Tax=Phenylobacterium sp. TaxID=1871053 RepID=UPI00286B752E|nr:alkaline phosphatase PhoX [Phenylobacterium sp.]